VQTSIKKSFSHTIRSQRRTSKEITKDWSADLLIPADPIEMSDPELIGSSEATHKEHDTPGTSRRKKTKKYKT
jgi:hypothetical protein